MLEVDELGGLRRKVSSRRSAAASSFRIVSTMQPDCPRVELERAARTSVALDRLVEAHKLGSLALTTTKRENSENEDTSVPSYWAPLAYRARHTRGRRIRNQKRSSMKIMDCFGVGGSFTEYYAVDFNDDVILMGHDGPGHIALPRQNQVQDSPN